MYERKLLVAPHPHQSWHCQTISYVSLYVLVSPYGFNLHFLDDQWHWASFSVVYISYSCILGEMCVEILCPFFDRVVLLWEFLDILVQILCQIHVLQIFSPACAIFFLNGTACSFWENSLSCTLDEFFTYMYIEGIVFLKKDNGLLFER